LSVYIQDITERKRAEAQLRYHAYLLENVQDAVIGTDERLLVMAWNKGAESMYGWRADEVLGRHIWEVVPVELSEEERGEVLKELSESGQFHIEAIKYAKDATPVWVEGITIALRDEPEGEITGYVNIWRDISERKRTEERLEEAREAERGRMARDLHDEALKELSGAMAYVQLLRRRPEEAHLRLEQLSAALKRTEQRVRSAVYDLGRLPPALARDWIRSALCRDHGEHATRRTISERERLSAGRDQPRRARGGGRGRR
jgi:PAS domain S-box-containing protein